MTMTMTARPAAPVVDAFDWEVEPDPRRSELLHWRRFRLTLESSVLEMIARLRNGQPMFEDEFYRLETAVRAQMNQLMDLDRYIARLEGRVA
jgi:hypothetical protein